MKWPKPGRITWAIFGIVVTLGVAARAMLPGAIERAAKRAFEGVPDVRATIDDVDVHLARGAFSIEGLEVSQRFGDTWIEVLEAPAVELSVDRAALLDGEVAVGVALERPRIDVVAGRGKEQREALRALGDRLGGDREEGRIDRVDVRDGELHFRNLAADPQVDVFVAGLRVAASDLKPKDDPTEGNAAKVTASGRAMSSGRLELDLRFDPAETLPTYDVGVTVEDLEMAELNPYLIHYAHVAAREGRISLAIESEAEDGGFRGAVEPEARGLELLHVTEDPPIGETFKWLVEDAADLIGERPEHEPPSRVVFSGSFDEAGSGAWKEVGRALRGAFARVLEPAVEGAVSPEEAKRFPRG